VKIIFTKPSCCQSALGGFHSFKKQLNNSNMKNLFYSFVLLLIVSIIFTRCGTDDEGSKQEYATINGVKWATRNVAAPGTFSVTPESMGMLYQWNRRTALTATINSDTWDWSNAIGATWESVNDPCPEGWRVPTLTELRALAKAPFTKTTQKGTDGLLIGIGSNQIFLPITGILMDNGNGGVIDIGHGNKGAYWSNTQEGERAYLLYFSIPGVAGAMVYGDTEMKAMAIRCVVK
jgi:uncharacterized protein (TIGR02145 family)